MAKKKEPIEDLFLSDKDLREATIITEGRKSWTFRDYNLIFDRPTIIGASEANKIAGRIFLTGEVHADYIGDEAVEFLLGVNDAVVKDGIIPPLFTETRWKTIRMERFDPKFVWPIINPDLILEYSDAEVKRLQIPMDGAALDYFDFYESMIHSMKKHNGDFCVPSLSLKMDLDTQYCVSYLACLLLFGKPGYMGTHISEYFTSPETGRIFPTMKYRTLNSAEQKEVITLREKYGRIPSLVNDELIFVTTLYEDWTSGFTK